jgi:hypothetical protein
MQSVRGRYEVRKDNGASKLNMTDEEWVKKVKEIQAVGAREEALKKEK